ncbi:MULTISPECIES: hypothetical protein [Burkholderia]|uniref:hypothetical protein n=1 Tax=Burkholderia TaxID=32008 RepID=UPI0011AF7DBF|nr:MULTISPECIES: hypothetical protein [unclassified Burkholderia]
MSIAQSRQQFATHGVYTSLDIRQDGYSRQPICASRNRNVATGNLNGTEINNGFAARMVLDDGMRTSTVRIRPTPSRRKRSTGGSAICTATRRTPMVSALRHVSAALEKQVDAT